MVFQYAKTLNNFIVITKLKSKITPNTNKIIQQTFLLFPLTVTLSRSKIIL